MTPYAWSCLACEQTNLARDANCSRCACPAQAALAQVEAARAAHRERAGLPPTPTPDVMAMLEGLPLLLFGAAVLLLFGGVALVVGSTVSVNAFGALLVALAALCASSHRKRPPR